MTLEWGEEVVMNYLVNGSSETIYLFDDTSASNMEALIEDEWVQLKAKPEIRESEMFYWVPIPAGDSLRFIHRTTIWERIASEGRLLSESGKAISLSGALRYVVNVALEEGEPFPQRPAKTDLWLVATEPITLE